MVGPCLHPAKCRAQATEAPFPPFHAPAPRENRFANLISGRDLTFDQLDRLPFPDVPQGE